MKHTRTGDAGEEDNATSGTSGDHASGTGSGDYETAGEIDVHETTELGNLIILSLDLGAIESGSVSCSIGNPYSTMPAELTTMSIEDKSR